MKTRLTTVDIKALVNDFQSLISMRLNNVYDSDNNKGIILKLNRTGEKQMLLIESGVRIHTIQGDFSVFRQMPTSFASKLRKHLKNKRLEKVDQIGTDRIIRFQFGMGEYINYLICEFYANGNIILTDVDYKMLSKIRYHIYDENNKFTYPIQCFNLDSNKLDSIDSDEFNSWFSECLKNYPSKKLSEIMNFQDSPINKYPPVIINHSLRMSNLNPNKKLNKLEQNGLIENISYFIKNLEDIFMKIFGDSNFTLENFKGHIIHQNGKYHDFTPYLFQQYKNIDLKNPGNQITQFNTLNQALMEYYSSVKPLEHKVTEQVVKKNIKKDKHDRKVDHLKNQVSSLEKKVDKHMVKAEFIQNHLDIFGGLINIFKNYLSLGMSRSDMIISIKDDFILNNDYDEENITIEVFDVNLKDKKFMVNKNNPIEIYFLESVYDNISRYHQTKKHHRSKMEKAKLLPKLNKKK